jgi:hypothetical protein
VPRRRWRLEMAAVCGLECDLTAGTTEITVYQQNFDLYAVVPWWQEIICAWNVVAIDTYIHDTDIDTYVHMLTYSPFPGCMSPLLRLFAFDCVFFPLAAKGQRNSHGRDLQDEPQHSWWHSYLLLIFATYCTAMVAENTAFWERGLWFNALLSFTYTQNRHAVCATDGATKNSCYDSTQHILTFNIYLALESQRRERQYLQTLQY